MMRKYSLLFLTVFILASLNIGLASAETAVNDYNIVIRDNGIAGVRINSQTDKKMKVMIEKLGIKYTYNISPSENDENFPLQFGNGEYTVSILENTTGINYKVLKKETVTINLNDGNSVFLNSVQNIKWDESLQSIRKAKELTKTTTVDEQKVKLIYDYLIGNTVYDYDKASKIISGYLPNIDDTFKSGKGICYDYASLFAAMLRSVGVPAKLVMGTAKNMKEYHAWNEVYIQGSWVTIDTTVDSGLKKNKKKFEMIKNNEDYKTDKIY